jgi:hypothetical protein
MNIDHRLGLQPFTSILITIKKLFDLTFVLLLREPVALTPRSYQRAYTLSYFIRNFIRVIGCLPDQFI